MSEQHIDRSTLLGGAVALGGIVSGLLLDGGSIRQIVQPTAALIVVGGTTGAVMLQFPFSSLKRALMQLREGLFERDADDQVSMEQLLGYCSRARRLGIMALDAELQRVPDEFVRKALTLGVDGFAAQEIREVMERDLANWEENEQEAARVFEAAGGFSPTLGIMGAVLGLIQVMQHMDDIGSIGKGIAIAFVSTLYGIGLANLLFLPIAGKLRIRARARLFTREMALDAVVAIVQGVSPLALRQRLEFHAQTDSVALTSRELVTG
jgi:chemotaxis protein MotA